MKKYQSLELLNDLQSDVRQLLLMANYLAAEDPGNLLEQPGAGKWTVVQIIEHLNSYGRYYLPAIEKSLERNKPAVEQFKPGWLGDYFTKMMRPSPEGVVKYKMKSPRDHRPVLLLDPGTVLDTFTHQQHTLLHLLESAKSKDINAARVPVSISKFIRLKLGDTFRFLIAHEQRHFIQARNTLEIVKKGYAYSIAG